MRRLVLVLAVASLTLPACSGKGAEEAIAIVSTNNGCQVSERTVKAGRRAFTLENKGSKFAAAYIYAPGDRVVTERLNVGPGTKARFTVNLAGGNYEVACKPGQTGDGIRRKLRVAGTAKDARRPKVADRALSITAKDYTFEGVAGFTIKDGETIAFTLKNTGAKDHEFRVFDSKNKLLGATSHTKPNDTGTVTLTFPKAGTYRYVCDIDDHEERGMKGAVTVLDLE